MPHYYPPHRSVTPSTYTDYYPGVIPYEPSLTNTAEASALVPYSPPQAAAGAGAAAGETAILPAAAAGAAKSTGGFSLPNLGDLKGMIDRLGGIDGIIATVGKVQKVMQTVQQFAPMAKLITGLLPGGKGARPKGAGYKLDEYRPRRRRQSRGSARKSSRKGNKRSSSRARNGKAKRRR
ncbi:hypothetical protein QNH46_04730 [Paenibacillus woosongensis]|uniref:Tyrosine protein kinase n=1 Tax=Paenibacillus woosongensis TaxID=307580 RepID=A0AA95I3R7_9BACL|nr:hypothetical protein [Paenibacillus woosongensis]WHX49979.1 hypothetical protein QNH46_04730 [Paenibacillus woosongensis]GIP60574.1 hypothetical protein J15TS10_43880 [Paenibacillus woosongensis]